MPISLTFIVEPTNSSDAAVSLEPLGALRSDSLPSLKPLQLGPFCLSRFGGHSVQGSSQYFKISGGTEIWLTAKPLQSTLPKPKNGGASSGSGALSWLNRMIDLRTTAGKRN